MWLRTMMSGRDNVSVDVGRVLFAGVIVSAIGLEVFAVVVRGDTFAVSSFCTALSAVLLSGGASLAVKGHTEPEEHHP